GHPRINEFRQCLDSITSLKVEISGFNKKQIRYINSMLNGKVAAEKKKKVATLVSKFREEITMLMNELNKKNKKITELGEKYKDLSAKYHAIKKDHDTGDGYYTESRQLLECENTNLEFFEEIEAITTRNSELENNLQLIQQQ
ncbi:2858_t:CDS:2, partial [Ambispora leptoticha]